MIHLSRRELMKLGLLAGAAAALPGCASNRSGEAAAAASSSGGGPLRLVHFTDSHIQPEREASRGVATAMRHIREHASGASLLIAGGDMIMDGFDAPRERTQLQWDLWQKAVRDECPLPIEYVCGNHDIWGWGKKPSKTTGDEAGWGKKWWCQIARRETAFGALDRGRWRIILLDTVQPFGEVSYEGRIDEPQFAWLEAQLAAATTARQHVLIVGHIPIVSVSMVDADGLMIPAAQGSGIALGKGAVMMDCFRLLRLLDRYPCVRAYLSGHIHMCERIEYRGVSHICNGAVCGGWWRSTAGNLDRRRKHPRAGDPDLSERPARAEPGYAVVDLHDDGRVENRYVEYGWTMVE